MKQTKLYLSILFSVIYLGLFAQTARVSGNVIDEAGSPIYSVNVIIDASQGLATTTDFDGNYQIDLEPGIYKIQYRYLGKEDQFVDVSLSSGEKKKLDITLKDKSEIIDIVVVSASKYEKKLGEETVSIEVMKSDVLKKTNTIDMEEGMNRVPGVTVVEGQANIRGGAGWAYGAGSRVMVLVDELPLLSADAADAKWSIVPIENMEQVEVLKGAASALYGSSALNGIINMRTAWPTSEPYTNVTTYGGMYENSSIKKANWWSQGRINTPMGDSMFFDRDQPYFAGLSFAHRQKFGNFDLVLGGAFQADHSYLIGGSATNYRINGKTRYRFKKVDGLSIGVNFNFYNSWGTTFFLWRGNDSLSLVPMPNTTSDYITYRATVDPHLTYIDKKNNRFTYRGRYFNTTNLNNTKQGSVADLYYSEIQYQRMFEKIKFNIVGGIAGYYSNVHSPSGVEEESLIGNHKGYNVSAYLQADKKFFDRLTIAFGTRYEYFAIDSFVSKYRPVFRAGINYQAARATYIRASWGEGYRFPTMAEKFVKTSVGSIGIYPNPKLEPETGWSAELGIKQGYLIKKNWKGFVDVSGFINQYQNMMEFTFGAVGADRSSQNLFGLGFSAQNVGNTRIIGGELVFTLTGKIKKTPMTLLLGYTYIDPKSTNWNDTIYLINEVGDTVKSDLLTYGQTSSSETNILKYRNNHVLKADIEFTLIDKIDIGATVFFNSYMKNIDKFFIDGAAQLESGGIIGDTYTFQGLRDYRDNYNRLGDTNIEARIAYHPNEHLKLSLVGKNLLNQFSTTRPAYPDPPRNYTLQMSYTF